jgi:formyl-CoA transferase
MTNASVRAVHVDYCQAAIEKLIGSLTVAECVTALSQQKGPWSVVRTAQEVALDPQVAINGYLQAADCDDASVLLAASPVQFDEEIPKMTAAPRLGEHTASILDEIGISPDETDRLLESGVVCSDT